ncbi:restriction endonuclease subunit S [Natronosalvus caseinilyticus]|uniref:restriction endonuclease subunit S n=1 Tax=Natronosalvus caseinilyticus TaxID=2953747 RepID=UPI0028ACED07|nr:restriction endonuclease subunit S [Natronosalvus caseinilyticus]
MSEAVEKSKVREGYKEIHLGPKTVRIPEKWEVVKTNSVCQKITDGTHNSPDTVDEGYPYITSKNIRENGFRLDDIGYISEEDHKKIYSRCDPQLGDVLYVKDGANTGIARKNTLDFEFSLLSSVALIRTDRDRLDPDFLTHHLNWPLFKKVMQSKMSGTGISRLTVTKIKNSEVLLPPLPKQRRIADVLSTVDEQIQQTDKIIEEAKELKQGLMQDLLIGGLSNGSTQEIQIGPRTLQIPDHWDMEPCGQLFEAINGRAFKTEEWEEEGTQIIRIQDLRPGAEAETNYANFEVDDKYHVTVGDLLFCWAGNIKTSLGAYIWSGDDAYLNQHIYNLRPKKELDKRFFAFSLNQHLRLLKTMVGGSAGQVHITKADFEAFQLPVPPAEEQERIANIIGCAQKKIDEEKGRKEDLQELKRGLMQDLLTGTVRVNTD